MSNKSKKQTKSSSSSLPAEHKSKKAQARHPVSWLPWLALPVAVLAVAYSSGFFSSPKLEETSLEPYVVKDLPGRGKGLVASRDIKQGELVIRETPLFIVPQSISESPTVLISRLLSGVSAEDRQAFMNLSYVNLPPSETDPAAIALAIFQTNAVAAGNGVGIFPRMARLNHGCSSAFNVVYSWRPAEQALFVHALRDVRQGQELLTTYTDTKRPRSERREYLSHQYGFLCMCRVCAMAEAESQASDRRLTNIRDYYKHLSSWGEEAIDGMAAVQTINAIWKVENEEGYWSERGQLAADGAWIAAAHSDAPAVRSWAKLAIRWFSFELGADSELISEMRVAAEHPQAHRAWGSRQPMPVGAHMDHSPS